MKGRMFTFRRRAPLPAALCLLCAGTASAQILPCTKFFIPGGTVANISWHEDNNWIPVGTPGPEDVACVLEDGYYQVLVTEPVTIAGFRLEAAGGTPMVKILSTDFTLNGFGYLAGETKFKVNDGGVLRTDAAAGLEVHSKLVIDGGTVAVDVDLYGHLNYAGTGSLTGNLVTQPGSVIEYENTGADAHLAIAEGFDNRGEVVFIGTVEMTLEVISGTLVNAAGGVIRTDPGAQARGIPSELMTEIDNHGLIDVDGSDLRIGRGGSEQQNGADGEIRVANARLEIDLGGTIEVPSNFTNYGTVTVADGGSIRILGSAGPQDVPSNFTNYGTVTVADGGSIRVLSAAGESMSVVNSGFFDLESGGNIALDNVVFDNPSAGQVRGSGTLDLEKTTAVIFDGTLSPGFSPGILTVDGSVGLGPNARTAIDVGGEMPGIDLDRLDVTGVFGAGGELDVALVDKYQPVGGERFQILTFDSLADYFATTTLPPLTHLLGWNVDVGEHEIALDVICQGTQLQIDFAADRDPVSVDHECIFQARVTNDSQVPATGVVMSSALPSSLVYRPDLSSPECVLIGATVECSVPVLAPAVVWDLSIGVEAVAIGSVDTTGQVAAWECDTVPGDNEAFAATQVVAAAPCDANDDLVIDADDLEPAVGHIFGERAPGNPDCRLAGGITADDLAAIIEASQ